MENNLNYQCDLDNLVIGLLDMTEPKSKLTQLSAIDVVEK